MIPRTIHQMWIGSECPAEYLEYSRQWQALHPSWQYNLWADDPCVADMVTLLPGIVVGHPLYENAGDISREPMQYRSDVARYLLLDTFGGVWVDMDFKPQRRIDRLMGDADDDPQIHGWAAWEVTGKWVNNAILACVPGYEPMERIVQGLPAASTRPGANTVKSGPQYITPHLINDPNFMPWPKDFFYPYLWDELQREGDEFPDSYAVHLWNNRRKRK